MAVKVYYNNLDLFDGIGPVPLISRDVENVYINRVSHLVDKFSLSGRIKRTNCVSGFENPYLISKELTRRLSTNFKKFLIQENGSDVFSSDYAIVRSVRFNNDKWYDWIPYTIEVDCYRKGFVESHGVVDPNEEFSLEILEDNTIRVTISASCRGINNSKNGIKNAQDFISSFSSYNPSILDFYWPETSLANFNFFLTNKEETINRLTGEFSARMVFVGQRSDISGTYGTLTYTRDLSISETGEVVVTISGNEKCALNAENTINAISNDIKTKNWHSIANELYVLHDNVGTLFSNPTKFSLQRNVSAKSVSFSLSFSNKQSNNVYVIDETTITHDYERSINCIEASLSIRSNNGCSLTRWQNVLNYYNSLDFNQYIQDRWEEFGQSGRLDFKEKNRSYFENKFDGIINISARMCDQSGESCGCLEGLVYNMEFSPSLKQYSVSPTFGGLGCYYIEDLMAAKRANFSIRGSAFPSACCPIEKSLFQLKNRVNQVVNSFFPGSDKILETSQISETKPGGEVSFSFSWSADQKGIVPDSLL